MLAADSSLAIKLLHEIKQKNISTIISPLSASFALDLILFGSNGQTSKEIKDIIAKESISEDDIHEYFSTIYNSNNDALKIANKVFIAEHFNIKNTYISLLQKYYYGSALKKIRFSDGIKAAKEINDFVANSTDNEIMNFMDAKDLGESTTMIIVSALLFEKNWEIKFLDGSRQLFYSSPEVTNTAFLMRELNNYQYFENCLFQCLNIPYENDIFQMTVILPKEQYGLAKVIDNLDLFEVLETISKMEKLKVHLQFPIFNVESSISLKNILQRLGMIYGFDSSKADFSNMCVGTICISDVFHKAVIKVGPEGTKAAAATEVAYDLLEHNYDDDFIQFKADHPFLYCITDINKNILFMGSFFN